MPLPGDLVGCEFCTDPDGAECLPVHGLAPHIHTREGIAFSGDQPAGFTPDADDPRTGTYWCHHCGCGNPANCDHDMQPTGMAEPFDKACSKCGTFGTLAD